MEENKRPRAHFNIFDALIILLIVAVLAAAVLLRNRSAASGTSRNTAPMRVTVLLSEMPHGMTDGMAIGDDIYRSTDSAYLGRLVDFFAAPHEAVKFSPLTGAFEEYAYFESDDVYLVVEGEAYSTAKDIVVGSAVCKVGAELPVKGKGYAGIGYVVGIDTMGTPVASSDVTPAGDHAAVFTIMFSDVRDFTVENIRVGDRFYESVTGAQLGRVEGFAVEPCGETQVGADGEAYFAQRPNRYNVTVTLSGRFVDKADGYYLDGGTELKVGSLIIAQSQYVERQCAISGIVSID